MSGPYDYIRPACIRAGRVTVIALTVYILTKACGYNNHGAEHALLLVADTGSVIRR